VPRSPDSRGRGAATSTARGERPCCWTGLDHGHLELRQVGNMTGEVTDTARDLVRHARFPITTTARAPSVHNTRPWWFQVSPGRWSCGVIRAGRGACHTRFRPRPGHRPAPRGPGFPAHHHSAASRSGWPGRCRGRHRPVPAPGGWPARYPLHRSPSAGPGSGLSAPCLVLVQADGLRKLSPSSDRCLTTRSSSSRLGIPGFIRCRVTASRSRSSGPGSKPPARSEACRAGA
jgi:hypothetical protein